MIQLFLLAMENLSFSLFNGILNPPQRFATVERFLFPLNRGLENLTYT